jgi:sec-independent protein translocase protein TatB
MSGVGFWELVLLFLVGLIVLGPERLPRVANQLGTWLGQARRMSRVLKRQLEDELNLEKDLNFKTAPQPLPHKPVQRPKEYDDTFSAAHGPDTPGTGVDQTVTAEDGDEFSDTDVLDKAVGDPATEDDDSNADRDKATSGSIGKT